MNDRRSFLKQLHLLSFVAVGTVGSKAIGAQKQEKIINQTQKKPTQLVALRFWPGPDYTRLTIETDVALDVSTNLSNPLHLRLMMPDLRLDRILINDVIPNLEKDRFLSLIKVFDAPKADNKEMPSIFLDFTFKQAVVVKPLVLKPIANYKHRWVLDIYPQQEEDPLLTFLKDYEEKQKQDKSKKNQLSSQENTEIRGTQNDKNAIKDNANKKIPTIVLDAGHGGEDPGAIGSTGLKEKDVVLAIAKILKKQLEEQGYRVGLTRTGDYFVSLADRVKRARVLKADLFISIHADAFHKPTARGTSVFVLSEKGGTSAAASYLAKKENEADLIGGVPLKSRNDDLLKILLDLSTTKQIEFSQRFATLALDKLKLINVLHGQGVERAGFAVLKAPDIPSVLIETAFISHEEEEKKLASNTFKQEIANSLVAAVQKFFV